GNCILFEPHGRNEDAVNHVLRSQGKLHVSSHRQYQCGRKDVVSSRRVAWIQSERIAFIRSGELLSVSPSEDAVRPGIAEVPLKLSACDFDLERATAWMMAHHPRPKLLSGNIEPEKQSGNAERPCYFQPPIAKLVI